MLDILDSILPAMAGPGARRHFQPFRWSAEDTGEHLPARWDPPVSKSPGHSLDVRLVDITLVMHDRGSAGRDSSAGLVRERRLVPVDDCGCNGMVEEFRVPSGCYHLRLSALGCYLETIETEISPMFFVRLGRGIEALCALICPGDDKGYASLRLTVRVRHRFW